MVLLCGFMCKQCAGEYAKGGDKQAMANYEKMIADNTRAEATLAPEVTKVTVKIMRIPVEFYECGYSFRVGDGEYEGKALLDKLPEGGRIWISYLRDDPSVNCQDPAKSLESEKAKDSSIGGLLWATGWGLFGLIMLAGVFAKAN